MDKLPKIVKRQRATVVESKTESIPTGESSFTQTNESALSAQRADEEHSTEFVEPHLPAESWSAVDRQPKRYYPAVSHWQEELREIRQECDLDVWESCPYD